MLNYANEAIAPTNHIQKKKQRQKHNILILCKSRWETSDGERSPFENGIEADEEPHGANKFFNANVVMRLN